MLAKVGRLGETPFWRPYSHLTASASLQVGIDIPHPPLRMRLVVGGGWVVSIPTKVKALIVACAFGLFMVAGLVRERRDAARTPPAVQQAKLAAVQPRIPEGATEGSSAYPSRRAPTPAQIAAPAPGVDSTAAKPVIIAVVTPWIEIARTPQYVQASSAEREAIRDLYRRISNSCATAQSPTCRRPPRARRPCHSTRGSSKWRRHRP